MGNIMRRQENAYKHTAPKIELQVDTTNVVPPAADSSFDYCGYSINSAADIVDRRVQILIYTRVDREAYVGVRS